MKKLTIINGLMLGVVLYLLIGKYKKQKSCLCIDEKIATNTDSLSTDIVLETSHVVETQKLDPVLDAAVIPVTAPIQNPVNDPILASTIVETVSIIASNTFNAQKGFNTDVHTLEVQPEGKILVGGNFTTYQGVSANRIIRLEQNGDIDKTFSYGNGFNGYVKSIAIQPDGKILTGGYFTAYQGVSANNIIRLEQNGDIDKTFSYGNGFDGEIKSIAVQPDGKILIGGSFKNYQNISVKRIVRLNPNGTIDDTFIYGDGFDNTVHCIKNQPDGKILVGGYFKYYKNRTANRIIRLEKNGDIDTTFVYGSGFDASVDTVALQNDGKILAGGFFKNYKGLTSRGIIRLNTDGSIDNAFLYGTGFNDAVCAIEPQPDGKILVGGKFSNYNGISTTRIAMINPNGSMDETFIYGTGFNNTVSAIKTLQSETTIIGGAFTNYNGSVHNRIVSIDNKGAD